MLKSALPDRDAATETWSGDFRAVRMLRALRDSLAPDGRIVLIAHTPHGCSEAQVRASAQIAGLLVERLEIAPGRLRLTARRTATPPDTLAATIWGLPQEDVTLDLRYAPDEAELLDPPPANIWRATVSGTEDGGASLAEHYPVDDPFGGVRGSAAVAKRFSCELGADQVTFGAGVSALLHDLVDLADGGPIAAPPLVHADLESRAFARGLPIRVLPDGGDPSELVAAVRGDPPAIVHLDRPAFTGQLVSLDALAAIVQAAAGVGALVVIDEAAATYLEPALSAVTLVNGTSNLVVVRGFTKAYSWGGLRVGFTVASRGLAPRVRSVVAPMQVSQPAFAASLRLLELGDCCARLRSRIRLMRSRVEGLLQACGLEPLPGHPDLPWIAMHEGRASAVLDAAGMRPLRPIGGPGHWPTPGVLRITIPLTERRLEQFGALLSAAAERAARDEAGNA